MLALRFLVKLVFFAFVVMFRRLFIGPKRVGWGWRHELIIRLSQSESRRLEKADFPAIRGQLEPPLKRKVAGLEIVSVDAGGVPAEWFLPSANPDPEDLGGDGPVVFYIHGGGFVLCSPRAHQGLIGRIARGAGARTLAIDYRLAPEHPFPAPIEDALTAYRWLLGRGVAPSRITVAGDSAGGNCSLGLMIKLRDAGEPLPGRLALLSPWVDLEGTSVSTLTNQTFDLGDRSVLLRFSEEYRNGADPRDPLVSPVHADLRGLPPTLVQVGEAEMLRDEVRLLVERMRAAGVEVKLEVWDDMFHVWQAAAPLIKEGRRAVDHIVDYILGQPGASRV